MTDLTSGPGAALQFIDLVNLSFAAYSQYDPETNSGTPAVLIFDDIELIVQHVGDHC